MAEFLSIEADISEAQKALAGTNKSLKSIKRQTVGIVARGAVKQIKAVINATTQKQSGELAKAYRYKVKRDGSEANVYPKALKSNNTIFPKAMTLSYGHSGPTKRAANWNIRALGFVQSGKAWIASGSYMDDIENMVDKQLQKYWGD